MDISDIDGDGDICLAELPPIRFCAKQVSNWNGKKVEVLDSSHTILGENIKIPTFPDQNAAAAAFYQRAFIDLTQVDSDQKPDTTVFHQRVFVDLTHADFSDEELADLVEGDFEFAESLAYIGSNYSPEATLEELLERTGMMFDRVLGERIDCKSAWKKFWNGGKKVLHKLEKECRKTVKKTVEFVKEHKEEILIGIGVVAAGVVIGTAVAAYVSVQVAADVITATAAVAASEVNNASKRRKEEEDDDLPQATPPSAAGPDPQNEPSSVSIENRVQQFLDDMSKLAPVSVPAPNPRYSIYRPECVEKQQNRAPEPSPEQVHKTASSAPNETTVLPSQINNIQQFFDNLLKPTSAPDPRSSIYRPEYVEKQKQSQAPSEPAAETAQNKPAATMEPLQLKSAFTAHLENLVRRVMEPDFQPNTTQINTIQPGASTKVPTEPMPTNAPSENILSSLFGKIQEGIVTVNRALDETRPLNAIAPADLGLQDPLNPSNSNNKDPKKAISPLSQKFVERQHVSVPVDWVVSLPSPPDVGIVPVLSPDGKLDWLVVCADWHKLDLSPEELQRGIVHFDEHLKEYIPPKDERISLITSQNGINVTLEEFANNCKADNLKIGFAMVKPFPKECPNLPLYVGIYNPTQGFVKDAWGAIKDICANGETTPMVRSTGRILGVLGTNAEEINDTFKLLHISHSRAGVILKRVLETNPEIGKLMHDHGLSVALGPALPISNTMAIAAVNFYSENDYVTKWFVFPFLNNKDYDIRLLQSKYISLGDFFRDGDDDEPLLLKTLDKLGFAWADHSRAGGTYDEALQDWLKDAHETFKFYDGTKND